MPYEVKYYTKITIELGEAFRGTGTLFFFPKGALTHHLVGTSSISLAPPQSGRPHSFRCASSPHKAGFAGPLEAVVSLPMVGHGALRGGFRFLRKAMDDAGKFLSSTQQIRDGTKCSILTCCLRKPATGSFAADMGASISRCTHFLFCERETEIGGEELRQFTIWKRRSSAEVLAALLLLPQLI